MKQVVDYFTFKNKLILIKYDKKIKIFNEEVKDIGIIIYVNPNISIEIIKHLIDYIKQKE